MWSVQIKGDIHNPERDYELSVIRDDYQLGKASWGWGCERKIILFGSGTGKNELGPRTPERIDFALQTAQKLADALNTN